MLYSGRIHENPFARVGVCIGIYMNSNMRDPLRLNVGFLLHEGVGFSRKFDFEHPSIHIDDDLEVNSLQGEISLTRTAQGLYARGQMQAQTPLQCVRCLKDIDQSLRIQFDDLFVSTPEATTDPYLVIPESGILDLNPIARDYFLLDFPMQPLCREDCAGLCSVCGKSLAESNCDHEEVAIDPRLAPLKELLSEMSR